MRFASLAAVLALAFTGCSPTTGAWTAPDLHAVSGYWMGSELPCPNETAAWCASKVATARDRVLEVEPEAAITDVRVAMTPTSPLEGGLLVDRVVDGTSVSMVVVTLASGERRVVGVICFPRNSMTVRRFDVGVPELCVASQPSIEAYKVGNEPEA